MRAAEKAKYEKAWDHNRYRRYSPGEMHLLTFLKVMRPKVGSRIIDFGCGPGRASHILHDIGYDMSMVDIAENCLDKEVNEAIGDRLRVACLWDHYFVPHSQYGICVDVMEHIPTEYVEQTVRRMLDHADDIFFMVSFMDDKFGEELEEDLHLTVKPFTWWRDTFGKIAHLKDGRDLVGNGLFRLCKSKGA